MFFVWRYRLSEPYSYCHNALQSINYQNDWVSIKNGEITISTGYAWDGCSPKWTVLGLITIGTPDGTLRYSKPWTWEASLVHDALYQFRDEILISKQQATQIFNDQLAEAKWPLRRLYVWAADRFGPQDFRL